MTVLHTWQRAGADGNQHSFAFLQCDGCFPPRFTYGTAATVAGYGWRFEELARGAHRCPTCPPFGARKPARSLRSRDPALPNLVIVGAAKSGTTSLHRYLSEHPEIQMTAVKELRFFQEPHCLERLDDYAAFFDASVPVRGEATPAYSCYPLIPGVPYRIYEAIPHARLIYLIRDPVERAIAAYAEAQSNEKETRSADEALGDTENPYNAYVAESRYAMQVERYLKVFPGDQLLVVRQQDLLERRSKTLRRIFGFLNVDQDFTSPRFQEMANTRKQKRRRNRVGRMLHHSGLAPVAKRIPPGPRARLLKPVRSLTSRPIEVTVAPEVRARLDGALRDEIERLTAMACPLNPSGLSSRLPGPP